MVLVLCIAVLDGLHERRETFLSCRVLSNGMVPWLAARAAECPLKPYDRVFAIERQGRRIYVSDLEGLRSEVSTEQAHVSLWVRRRGVETPVSVPLISRSTQQRVLRLGAGVLASVLLLVTALVVMWTSSVLARWPLLNLCGALSVLLIVTLADPGPEYLNAAGACALGLCAAALLHLALTFPKEGSDRSVVSVLSSTAYFVAGLLVVVSLLTVSSAPMVWAIANRLLMVLALAGAASILVRSILTILDARSQLERARAKIVLYGLTAVLGVPILVSFWSRGVIPGGSATLLGLGAVMFPLPIGYAISRYHLFDATLEVQRLMARLMVPTILAVLATGAIFALRGIGPWDPLGGEPAGVFAAVYGFLLCCELARAPLWSAADAWASRRLELLRSLKDAHAKQIQELLPSGDYGRILGRVLERGLSCREVVVYVADSGGWRLVYGSSSSLAPVSTGMTGSIPLPSSGELVHLALEDLENVPSEWSRFEIVVPLMSGGLQVGGVLVGPSTDGHAYSSVQLGFVQSACSATAAALHNLHLAQDLAAAERFAAVGKLGAELAHELGKPLGLLERTASRLPARIGDPERARRDALLMFDLAKELRTTLRAVLGPRDRAGSRSRDDNWTEVGDLVDRALLRLAADRGETQLLLRLEPNLPTIPDGGGRVAQALANCLENAWFASSDSVEVTASRLGPEVEIIIVDHGEGMTASIRDRAFEPFFSTRTEDEGAGLGLPFAREAIEAVGGRIALETTQGVGTRVIIRLPHRGGA